MSILDKMKDAKNMYSNIKKAQDEINKIKVEGSAGAGAVIQSKEIIKLYLLRLRMMPSKEIKQFYRII